MANLEPYYIIAHLISTKHLGFPHFFVKINSIVLFNYIIHLYSSYLTIYLGQYLLNFFLTMLPSRDPSPNSQSPHLRDHTSPSTWEILHVSLPWVYKDI